MTHSRILTLDTRSARKVASGIPLPILRLQCERVGIVDADDESAGVPSMVAPGVSG